MQNSKKALEVHPAALVLPKVDTDAFRVLVEDVRRKRRANARRAAAPARSLRDEPRARRARPVTLTDAPSGTAAARLIDFAGKSFLTVIEPTGRQATAPVELTDPLTPQTAADLIERATGVRLLMPGVPTWPRVVFDAWQGGPAQ